MDDLGDGLDCAVPGDVVSHCPWGNPRVGRKGASHILKLPPTKNWRPMIAMNARQLSIQVMRSLSRLIELYDVWNVGFQRIVRLGEYGCFRGGLWSFLVGLFAKRY